MGGRPWVIYKAAATLDGRVTVPGERWVTGEESRRRVHELRGWVDAIVSNPPYVPPEEIDDLPAEVRADPRLALAGGTEVHRRLAEEAPRWLRSGAALAVEIDARQGAEVSALLSGRFARVHVERDLAGRDRVVLARMP